MTIHPNITPDSTTTPPAVYVENLSFRYRSLDDEPQQKSAQVVEAIEPLQAIEEISFSLPAGKLMLIAEPSGCGKSTLLKCLNGLIPHSYKGNLSFFLYNASQHTRQYLYSRPIARFTYSGYTSLPALIRCTFMA